MTCNTHRWETWAPHVREDLVWCPPCGVIVTADARRDLPTTPRAEREHNKRVDRQRALRKAGRK